MVATGLPASLILKNCYCLTKDPTLREFSEQWMVGLWSFSILIIISYIVHFKCPWFILGLHQNISGLPVTIRLLDPPLHEFLPEGDLQHIVSQLTEDTVMTEDQIYSRSENFSEVNPMLGFRGCRCAFYSSHSFNPNLIPFFFCFFSDLTQSKMSLKKSCVHELHLTCWYCGRKV